MVGEIGVSLAIFISSILFYGFFSSTEAAFFTLGEYKLKQLMKKNSKTEQILLIWFKYPNKIINTIILGKVLSSVIASLTAGSISYNIDGTFHIIMLVASISIIIIIFGELIPKSIARNKSATIIVVNSYFLKIFFYFFLPVSWLMKEATNIIFKIFGNDMHSGNSITEEDIAYLIEEESFIEDQKQQMLTNIFEIYDTQTKEVMVPRTEMTAVPVDISKEKLMSMLKENEYSRLPVYENTLDNVRGILHIKDLLKLGGNWTAEEFLATAHPAKFVPETKKIDILLKEFQRERQQMAIVVDEYGGVSGLITMEDILEEIVGEIRDEYDADEKEFEVQIISPNHYIVDGIMHIDDFCQYFNIPKTEPMSEYDTVSGLVYDIASAIPQIGDEFEWLNFKIKIRSMTNNKLDTIDFIVKQESDGDNKNG